MKIENKEGIKGFGMTLCILVLVISTLIYPLIQSGSTWKMVAILCAIVVLVLILLRGTISIPKGWMWWVITLFPLFYNSYSLRVRELGFSMLWLALMLILLEVSHSSKWIEYAMWSIGILSCLYAISTIMFNLNIDMGLQRLATMYRGEIVEGYVATAGFTSHYSHNGMYIAIGCILWYAISQETKKVRHFLMLFVFIVALLFTQKRGPLIALAAAIVLTYYFSQRGTLSARINRLFVILIVLLFAIYTVYVLMPSAFAVFERFSSNDNMLTNRQYLWDYAIKCFERHPIIGNGWGYYPHALAIRIDTVLVREMNAHNIYLQLLAETGIVGFICFLMPMIYTFIRSIQLVKLEDLNRSRAPIYYAICMQIFFIVYGFSGNPLYDRQIMIPYMIAVMIVLNYYNIYRQRAD